MQSDAGNVTQAQEWKPRVICPSCLSAAVEVTRTMPVCDGDLARVRYHRCRVCTRVFNGKRVPTTFKSVETLTKT
jgi:hypothetical protein